MVIHLQRIRNSFILLIYSLAVRGQSSIYCRRSDFAILSTMASLITSTQLPIFIDCLEFCPFETHIDFLACGLYQLQDGQEGSNQIRKGGVQLLRLPDSDSRSRELFEQFAIYRIDTSGILALRWLSPEKLICACSDSQLRILNVDHSKRAIDCETSIQILDDNILLSVEIDQARSSYLVGHSTGHVSLGRVDQPEKFESWAGHGQSEVWCVEFHRSDPNQLLTGADDGLMKVWDRRIIDTSRSTDHRGIDIPQSIDRSLSTDEKSSNAVSSLRHDAGVTAILSTHNPHKIWTGSYDDQLRLWDLRNRKTPVSALNLGGGVWRIRPNGRYLLCACMYNGWSILECAGDASGGSEESDQMVIKLSDDSCGAALLYGIDWVPGKSMVTCSTFYDYTVRLYDLRRSL